METTSISKTDITLLETQLIYAIKTSDIAFLEKVLHDDLLFLTPDGSIITKAIDLASHRAGEMNVEEITATIEEINLFDDTAIAVVVCNTKGTMLGNPIEGKFRYIRVWKQFADGIKIIGGSCCKI